MLGTKEHYDLIEQFEKVFKGRHDKESKDWWVKGRVYQNGKMHELFEAYQHGYALGKVSGRESEAALLGAELARLRAENERYREALEDIEEAARFSPGIRDIVRAALNPTGTEAGR